jgi:hypothetical protein
MYRLRMNRCGSHAKSGALEHNFNQMSFTIRPGRRCRESFDGLTKAAPNQESSPKGCDDA